MRVLIFHLVAGSYDSWIERVCISIDACWYLNKFILITASSSGARDIEMLRQRNIQEVVFYFVQKDKVDAVIVGFLTSASQVYLACV